MNTVFILNEQKDYIKYYFLDNNLKVIWVIESKIDIGVNGIIELMDRIDDLFGNKVLIKAFGLQFRKYETNACDAEDYAVLEDTTLHQIV